MSEHLPECPAPFGVEPHVCTICAALRACEQRVRMEDDDYAYVAAQAEADGRWRGWVEALDAARDAVAAIQGDTPHLLPRWVKRDALAAIDALRGVRVLNTLNIGEISINSEQGEA